MKKILILFLAVALLAGTFASVSGLYAGDSKKPVYVSFGDSIAAGYRLPATPKPDYLMFREEECSESDCLYVNMLGAEWGAEVWNYAQNGRTTTGLLAYIQNANESLRTQIKKADIITISIGGNDLLNGWDNAVALAMKSQLTGYIETNAEWDTMIATLKSNYSGIVETIHALNPDVHIYGQTMYNPYKYNSTYTVLTFNIGTIINPYVKLLNRAYAELDEMYDYLTFVDVASAVNAYEASFYSDGDFHPTQYGHAMIASALLAAIPAPGADASSSSSSTTATKTTASSATTATTKTTTATTKTTTATTKTTTATTKTTTATTKTTTATTKTTTATTKATTATTKATSATTSATATTTVASSQTTSATTATTTVASSQTTSGTTATTTVASSQTTSGTTATTTVASSRTTSATTATTTVATSLTTTATTTPALTKTTATVTVATSTAPSAASSATAGTTASAGSSASAGTENTAKTTEKTTLSSSSSAPAGENDGKSDPGPIVAILALVLTGVMITALYIKTKSKK